MLTAYAEAVERDTIFALKEDFLGRYADNDDFLSPTSFGHPDPGQHEIEWVRFLTDAARSVYLHRPTRHSCRSSVYRHTSNGIAVHVTQRQAFESAKLEILERHWLVEFWEQRVTPVHIAAPNSHLVRKAEQAGWMSSFFVISRPPFVAICVLQASEKIPLPIAGGVCVGAKAHTDLRSACLGAFSEALQLAEGVSSAAGLDAMSESARFFFSGNGRELLLARLSTASRHWASLNVVPTIDPASIYRREIELDDFFYCEVQIAGLNPYPPTKIDGGYLLPL